MKNNPIHVLSELKYYSIKVNLVKVRNGCWGHIFCTWVRRAGIFFVSRKEGVGPLLTVARNIGGGEISHLQKIVS